MWVIKENNRINYFNIDTDDIVDNIKNASMFETYDDVYEIYSRWYFDHIKDIDYDKVIRKFTIVNVWNMNVNNVLN
jgi:hypothetical protein